jgi:Cu-processing system ATP-binding protein
MIEFRALSKRFGTVQAVTDLTWTAGRGEVVALLGPNGSGKTTSIKAAAGLIHPTSGEVLLGEPGQSAMLPAARESCSFLPQRVRFPEALTGSEVVEFYCRLRARKATGAKAILSLTGLNGASARSVGTYSGGMMQRLGLAVAMSLDTPILLLDEPTAALDPEGLRAFHELVVRRRADGRTVLFSSHQLADVERLADRIIVLVGGRLVASFTASDLALRLTDRGVMKITVESPQAGLLDTVRTAAPEATLVGSELVVPAPADVRPRVIDLVRASGAVILRLSTEEGRLEALYRDLTGGQAC